MRITYFADTYRVGGAERFLANVVAGSAGAGHDVTVVSAQEPVLDLIAGETPVATLLRLKTDVWARTSRRARIGAFARALPELPIAIRQARPQLVHVNNGGYPGSEPCRAAAIVARFAGAQRCVLSVNSTPAPREESQPQIQAMADQLLWRSVDAVHVGTRFAARRLSQLRGMPEPLGAHIAYGVAEPSGMNSAVEALRARFAPGGSLLVGMISATSEPEKGHAVLAEALARADPTIHAIVVGANPGEDFAQHLARDELSGRVAVRGQVAPEDFGAHVRALDVLIVPSTAYESLPLVILEAMAAGKPVFASRLSGIPEAVEDRVTGRLFEPGAAEELAALLRYAVLAREDLKTMGDVGRERWQANFSIDAMTTSMLDLYERLNVRRR
jgi:glycosyltransferase involved in cell wall biosynthesis